jgi:hypothetical protein
MDDDITNPNARHTGASTLKMIVTSLSAAVCVAGGYAIVLVAFVIAAANLLAPPPLLV